MNNDPEAATANEADGDCINVDEPVTANEPDIYNSVSFPRNGDNICSSLIKAIIMQIYLLL